MSGTANPPDFHLIVARLTEFARRDEVRALLHFYLAVFVVDQILKVVWWWVASKIVVGGKNASIGNALKLWISGMLLSGVFFAALIFTAPLLVERMNVAGIIALIGGASLVCVFIGFLILMAIYEIGFFRALGFIAMTIVISLPGYFIERVGMGKAFGAEARVAAIANAVGKTDAERQAFADRLFGKDAPDEIDRMLDAAAQPIGNPKPLAEREAAIQVIQQKLEARRRTLPPADREALAAFQLRLDRYVRVLNQVKTERAAQPAPPKKP